MDLNDSDVTDTSEHVTDAALKETCLRCFPEGTVLVAMYGGFQQIGRTGLLRVTAAVNQAITAIRVDDTAIDPKYLQASLNYRVGYWKGVASSSRRDPNITGRDVRRFPLAHPKLSEQRAVASTLSDVDALLGALDRLIAKKRDLKQAAMQQLLTGRTRLPGFGGEWRLATVEELAAVDSENLSGATDPSYAFNYIALEQVDCGRLLGTSPQLFGTSPSRARRVLRHDDVLISTVRPNLMAHLLFRSPINNAVCSTGFSVLRARRGAAAPGFLYSHFFARPVNEQIERILAGSNYPAINGRDVRRLEIPCPPTVDEQTAIASVLSDMDAEIEALEARRAKTRDIKQAMMQELLTGRTRLV